MRRWFVLLTLFVVALNSMGCVHGIRQNSAKRLARKKLESTTCDPKEIRTEIVRELDDRRFDYLAQVHAEGCGRSGDFLCGQKGSAWACEPVGAQAQ